MNDRKAPQRPYSDKEVGKLIQRATELQEESQQSLKQFLTLNEIEEIAAEIGIDPESLRVAALELDRRRDSDDNFSLTGAPFAVQVDRFADGQITDKQWGNLVLEIQRATGNVGEVRHFGNTRAWVHLLKDLGTTYGSTQVAVTSAGEQTEISVQKQYRGAALMLYMVAFMLSAGAAGVLMDGSDLSGLMNFLIAGGSGLGGLAVARASLEVWARTQRAKAQKLAQRLQSMISGISGETASELEIAEDVAVTDNSSARVISEDGESYVQAVGEDSGEDPLTQKSRTRS